MSGFQLSAIGYRIWYEQITAFVAELQHTIPAMQFQIHRRRELLLAIQRITREFVCFQTKIDEKANALGLIFDCTMPQVAHACQMLARLDEKVRSCDEAELAIMYDQLRDIQQDYKSLCEQYAATVTLFEEVKNYVNISACLNQRNHFGNGGTITNTFTKHS